MNFLIVHGGPGNGHYMRCVAIFQELERRGWTHTNDFCLADVVIADVGEHYSKWDEIHNNIAIGTVLISLDGPAPVFTKDNKPIMCKDIVEITTGYGMAPIRDEVRNAKVSHGDYVYISLGSVGRADYDAVKATVEKHGQKVYKSGYNHIGDMAGAKWVVTNGGLTMLEAMSMGKAVWAIPQTKAEWEFAFQAYRVNSLVGLGLKVEPPEYWRIPPDEVRFGGKPGDWDEEEIIRRNVGYAAHLVDGKGASRLADKIELNCLSKLDLGVR